MPLTLPVDSFPNAPHVSDFPAAQSCNPAASFNLTWDAFSGATPADDILKDVIDSGGNPVSSASLISSATNFNFPANTFRTAQTYQVTLNFRRFVSRDTTTYPGATGAVIFSARTFFNLTTTSSFLLSLAAPTNSEEHGGLCCPLLPSH